MSTNNDVIVISWPSGEALRQELGAQRLPRLLVVDDDASPPLTVDPIEDWVWASAPQCDRDARTTSLRLRAGRTRRPPTIDAAGRLHIDHEWVALSPLEARMLEPLLHRFGLVVGRLVIGQAGWPESPPTRNQIDVHMLRLRRRIAPLGLSLRTIRGRGYSLSFSS